MSAIINPEPSRRSALAPRAEGGAAHWIAANRPAERGGFDVRRIAKKLLRHAFPILALLLLGSAAGFGLAACVTPRYTSYASILIDPQRPGSFGSDAEFANLYVDSTKIASVVSILESSVLLGTVVKNEHLADDPEFGDFRPSLSQRTLGFLPFMKARHIDPGSRAARALDHLSRVMRVTRVGFTYELSVDVTASTPAKAQRLTQAVAEAYLQDQIDQKSAATERDRVWLESRLSEARGALKRSEEAVEAVRRKFGLTQTDSGPGATVGSQEITALNTEFLKAESDVVATKTLYDQAVRLKQSGGDLGGLSTSLNSRVIDDLRGKEADVRRHLADLRSFYNPTYPEIGHAQNDLRAIDAQIGAEEARLIENIHNDYEAAAARQDALKRQLAGLTSTANDAGPSNGLVELRDAQRVVQEDHAHYESLMSRSGEVEMQEAREDPEARILSPATAPASPSSPKLLFFVGGGGAGGLLLGLALAFLIPALENRFVSVEDMERTLALPVLGAVPYVRRRDLKAKGKRLSIVEYVSRNPLSRFGESLRALRTALGLFTADGPRIVQITSAMPGEGKSTMASVLAVSAAMAGVRTALVDVDLRYYSVSGMFGLQGRDGVVEILRGDVPLGTVWYQHERLPLTVIGGGSTGRPEPDIIASSKFRNLVNELAKSHDLVILDSPPVLAVSDALMISSLADATLLVVEWRGTVKEVVAQAITALRAANAPLAGILFNKADLPKLWEYDHANCSYRDYRRATDRYHLAS